MKKAIIFDLDGTLANIDKRRLVLKNNPKDWEGFFNDIESDIPNDPIVMLYKVLASAGQHTMMIVSGRPDLFREQSENWLKNHDIVYSYFYMREQGDRRPDYIVKEEILEKITSMGFEVVLSVDDRNSVVEMWRKHGIVCLQCADGDF